MKKKKKHKGPKILIFDIETAPSLAYVWSLWDQNIGLNQIHTDWHVLSWAAKWHHEGAKKVMYRDQRNMKDITDDKKILQEIWHLLDEADIVVTQNGQSFDVRKLNARFVLNGMKPPSSYRNIDTLRIAKRHFKFSSNKLEYMTDKICKKYKKLKHGKFPGFELWAECLKGNKAAWNEMKKYNIHDVLALEELFETLIKWDDGLNFTIYFDEDTCSCGSNDFNRNGYYYTNAGKYQRYKCKKCNKEYRGKKNLIKKNFRVTNRRG